jgi:hypothetical protein
MIKIEGLGFRIQGVGLRVWGTVGLRSSRRPRRPRSVYSPPDSPPLAAIASPAQNEIVIDLYWGSTELSDSRYKAK